MMGSITEVRVVVEPTGIHLSFLATKPQCTVVRLCSQVRCIVSGLGSPDYWQYKTSEQNVCSSQQSCTQTCHMHACQELDIGQYQESLPGLLTNNHKSTMCMRDVHYLKGQGGFAYETWLLLKQRDISFDWRSSVLRDASQQCHHHSH